VDQWTRVSYFLPITSVNDKTAYLRVLNYLRSRHPQSGHPQPISGFTSTVDDPEYFKGYYWSREHRWVDDSIALLFIDFPKTVTDPGLEQEARAIKTVIESYYEQEGSKQDEVWVTAETIHLVI
jgi:hypothetical protein